MDDKKRLLAFLKSFQLMILATAGKSAAAATVRFGIDDDFNFYIVTPPSTEHGQHIESNFNVACVIVDTKQELKTKKGAQIKGKASRLVDIESIKNGLIVWANGDEATIDLFLENIANGKWSSRIYKITPTEIKWMNEELYGEEGNRTFSF
ncbi:hypothetical protein BH09PAT1_BH09PAT1_6660 [soil metagenome]